MRSVTRTLGVSYNAVSKLLTDAGDACAEWHDRAVRDIDAGHVQCDEVWAFCYAKQKQVPLLKSPPEHAGHTWTWTALDTDSKLMVSWLTAPRGADGAFVLMADLASRMKSCRLLTSDGLYAYESAVEDVFGRGGIDFGMYVKPSTTDSPVSEDVPLDRSKPVRRGIFGDPNEEEINTSYVERANLTLRMGNRRFTRKTNAFSKKLENHKRSLALFYVHYNWCRPHRSLKGKTPAMAAGLAQDRYPVSWIVDLIDARAPKPNRPKHYKRRAS